MRQISWRDVPNLIIIAILIGAALTLVVPFVVKAGAGAGGSSSGGNITNNQSCGSNCTQYNQNGDTYQTTSNDYNNDGDIKDANEVRTSCTSCDHGDPIGGSRVPIRGTSTPPVVPCTDQPNLQTIDIFFVPAGTQPAPQTSNRQFRVNLPANFLATNPYQQTMVTRNELEAGVSYEPVAQIRNTATCQSKSPRIRRGMQEHDHAETMNDRYGGPTSYRFNFINTAYAGGGSRPKKNDYPNFFRNQLPFGANGSFPVRARIDVGQNTSYEWEQYVNAFGPVTNGQTVYLKLPAFTTAEVGTHRIEIVTDIRHSVDPGRACFAATTPASAGWGCAQETSETDNDRSEVFTTGIGSTSLRLAVDVSDVHVRTGSVVTEIPFVTINSGRATISSYNYRVTIGSSQYASGTRTTSLVPTSRETVRAAGVYTAPTARTSVPLTVCAQVATSTEVCDTARVIVDTPQCSDARDNDTDGTQDAGDASCYSDPLDPATYNPDDDNEGDLASSSPSVDIEFKPVVNPVRYNTGAVLSYVINGGAPMSCVVTGGGTNTTITHVPPRTTGQITTAPVTSTQQYTLRCTAMIGGGTFQIEKKTTVDVLPQIQEI